MALDIGWVEILISAASLLTGGGLFSLVSKRVETLGSAQYLFRRGARMSDKGRHKRAAAYFDRALEKDPAAVGALEKQAQSTFATAQYKQAEFSLTKAIRALELQTNAVRTTQALIAFYAGKAEAEPDKPEWLLKKRECHEFMQEHKEDVEACRRLAACYAWRAWCYGWQEQDDKRDEDIATAFGIDKECAVAYAVQSVTLVDSEEKIEALEEAIRLDPNSSWAYNILGIVKHMLGILEQENGEKDKAKEYFSAASRDYDKAIDLNRKYTVFYYNRGLAKNDLGELEEDKEKAKVLFAAAIKDYSKAIHLDRKDIDLFHNRVIAYDNLKKPKKAAADSKKAAKLEQTQKEADNA